MMQTADPSHADDMHNHSSFQKIPAPQTAEDIAEFVAMVVSQPETMPGHHGDAGMMADHMAALDLVPREDATHLAITHGSWFDPATWADGEVPGAGAQVLIPEGIEVTYDAQAEARIFTIRVDGHLTFDTQVDTTLRVDTIVTSPTGHLTVGTEEDPVSADVTAEILFTNSGDIDVTWDAALISRGLIAMGTTKMHGQKTDAHTKVLTDPMAGDTSLLVSDLPDGWSIGDTLVIAGTSYEGYKWDNDIRTVRWHENEDEVRTISAIEETQDDVRISFDQPLEFDHDTPREDLKTSVANMSRHISFATEDLDAAVHQRAHVMFMHSDEVDVRYAAFHELGRTDKSERSVPFSDVDELTPDTNVQGRYALHMHNTGVEDPTDPAIIFGNAVFGSPGWGYVHHNSNAILHNNASFDAFGAGFVAETGNEIGAWTDNIAIGAQGLDRLVKDSSDVVAFDLARTGDGFWFQGRMVESAGNIAASVNHGFVYAHRGSGMLGFEASAHDYPEIFAKTGIINPDNAPVLDFRDNEAFAAKEGLHVVKANPNQGHDLHSHFKNFTAWEVKNGAHFEYTSHYTIENFDLVGKTSTAFNDSDTGISFGPNTSDMTVFGGSIEGFATAGIDLFKAFTVAGWTADQHGYSVVNIEFGADQVHFDNLDQTLDTVIDDMPQSTVSPYLELDQELTYREGYPDPGARIVEVSGTKIDSLGAAPFPAGTDSISFTRDEVFSILESDGYYATADGRNVFFVEIIITDRLTSEIVKEKHSVTLNGNVPLGNPYFGYGAAVFNGELEVDNLAPTPEADSGETMVGQGLIIDLLANDSDPDGDPISLNGVIQPENGDVFIEPDGTVRYRSDFGFSGVDHFEYWAEDTQGNIRKLPFQ